MTLHPTGADRLKEALQGLGLKSGGSLRERAARLYLTKGTPLAQLDKRHFAKGVVIPTAAGGGASTGKAEADTKKAEEGALQVCGAQHMRRGTRLKQCDPVPPRDLIHLFHLVHRMCEPTFISCMCELLAGVSARSPHPEAGGDPRTRHRGDSGSH